MNSKSRVSLYRKGLLSLALLLLLFQAGSGISFSESYLIGDEDVLNILVWGSPELSINEIPVRPDGMISVPLVGDVVATGIAPKDLKATIEKELEKFVKSPNVSVIVKTVHSTKIYVLGEGVPPGVITLKKNTTAMQLFAQFGTLKSADLQKAYVMRDGQKMNTSLYELLIKGDVSKDFQIKPNDILFIPDNFSKRIKIVGEVKTPGIMPYREGMTVLDAILHCGGFTEFAKKNDVIVTRKQDDEVANIEVRLKDVMKDGDISKDIILQPGDMVIVKTGIF